MVMMLVGNKTDLKERRQVRLVCCRWSHLYWLTCGLVAIYRTVMERCWCYRCITPSHRSGRFISCDPGYVSSPSDETASCHSSGIWFAPFSPLWVSVLVIVLFSCSRFVLPLGVHSVCEANLFILDDRSPPPP